MVLHNDLAWFSLFWLAFSLFWLFKNNTTSTCDHWMSEWHEMSGWPVMSEWMIGDEWMNACPYGFAVSSVIWVGDHMSFIHSSHVIHRYHVIHSSNDHMSSTDRMPLNHHIHSVVQWSQVIHSSLSYTHPMITCPPLVACHWIITFIRSSNDQTLSTHPPGGLSTYWGACLASLECLCFSRVRFIDIEQSQQRWGCLASGIL